MTSQAIVRVLLLVAVVGATNAAKPFTPTNLTDHFARMARSLAQLLPPAAARKIEQANLIAGMVSGEWRERTKRPCPNNDVLAAATPAGKSARKASGQRLPLRRADLGGRAGSNGGLSPLPVGSAVGKAVMMNLPVIALPAFNGNHYRLDDLRIPALFTPPTRKLACPLTPLKIERTIIFQDKAEQTSPHEAAWQWEAAWQHANTVLRVAAQACTPPPAAGSNRIEAKRAG